MVSHCLVTALFTPPVRILRRGRTYVFGRDARADFPLPSELVSRRHAEVIWNPSGGFALRDIHSKNGTRVNDLPVLEPCTLHDGDRISIGPFDIQYREYQGDIAALIEESDAGEATTTLRRDGHAGGSQLPPATPSTVAFAGNFAGHELLEILKVIAFGERDGVLTIQAPAVSGQLTFERGEIRRAQAADLRAEQAALVLLSLPDGRFEFTSVTSPFEPNCRIGSEGIAMEVARLLDERARKASSNAATGEPEPTGPLMLDDLPTMRRTSDDRGRAYDPETPAPQDDDEE